MPVRIREWARLKQRIDELRTASRAWSGAGWSMLGIGVSAFVSWLPYMVAGEGQKVIAIVTLVVAMATLFGGLLALLAARSSGIELSTSVRDAQRLMLDMESSLDNEQRRQITSLILDAP